MLKSKKGEQYVHIGSNNFVLMYNMMIGIKKSVDSCIDHPCYKLQKDDFRLKCKFYIDPYSITSNAKRKYRQCMFVDYAPQIFNNIRRLFGINKEDYLKDLGPQQLIMAAWHGDFNSWIKSASSGKSGSFFYYTKNAKYILKTISKKEALFLRKILPNYYSHLKDYPDTLITRYYGAHKIIFYKNKSFASKVIYFTIMNNVFLTSKTIDIRYDLKGSILGRTTKDQS